MRTGVMLIGVQRMMRRRIRREPGHQQNQRDCKARGEAVKQSRRFGEVAKSTHALLGKPHPAKCVKHGLPWSGLLAVISPHYSKGERGRPPMGLERMLRVYFLQQWYGLADEALEDALGDSQALQRFARIELGAEGVPDATTLLKFRRLLQKHDLCKGLPAQAARRRPRAAKNAPGASREHNEVPLPTAF
jgi:hypothetical protein